MTSDTISIGVCFYLFILAISMELSCYPTLQDRCLFYNISHLTVYSYEIVNTNNTGIINFVLNNTNESIVHKEYTKFKISYEILKKEMNTNYPLNHTFLAVYPLYPKSPLKYNIKYKTVDNNMLQEIEYLIFISMLTFLSFLFLYYLYYIFKNNTKLDIDKESKILNEYDLINESRDNKENKILNKYDLINESIDKESKIKY